MTDSRLFKSVLTEYFLKKSIFVWVFDLHNENICKKDFDWNIHSN